MLWQREPRLLRARLCDKLHLSAVVQKGCPLSAQVESRVEAPTKKERRALAARFTAMPYPKRKCAA